MNKASIFNYERVYRMSKYNYKVLSIIDSFQENGYVYKVFDVENNIRQLAFKTDKMTFYYLHSAIYKDFKSIHQPIYEIPQRIFDLYSTYINYANVLVLGCAGCSIPRYFAINYPQSHITGVEYSDLMITIAKKYFYINDYSDRFNLIHNDAFIFIKEPCSRKFDMLFVDLFENNELPISSFDNDFFSNISHIAKNDSVTLFNLLDISSEAKNDLYNKAKNVYSSVTLIHYETKVFLVATKGKAKLANNEIFSYLNENSIVIE